MAIEPRDVRELAPVRASIVIPVRNRGTLTRSCLNALLREARPDVEIVVVDDGSSRAEAAALQAYGDQIRIVRPPAGSGFATACNAGVAAARGPRVVLLNNDVLPLPGWLEAMERLADAQPEAGIVGARLLWPDHTVQCAGVVVGSDGLPRHLYAGWPGDHPVVCRNRRLRMVTGAAMLISREAWSALGGFDTGFRNSFEDVDLCLRAGQLGLEVQFCGEAALMHLESATRGRMPLTDEENFRRLTDRWGPLESDEVAVYAADGVVRTRQVDGRAELEADPRLGRVERDPSAIDELLRRRAHQVQELRTELLRLRAAAADPWSGVLAIEPLDPELTTVVVAASDHGQLDDLLTALEAQTAPPGSFEVVVANPGFSLPLASSSALARERRFRVRSLDAPAGRAAAWNRGLQAARGELVILLADDFLPSPEFVARHVALHREDPVPELVGIGPSRFPDEVRADPFARWVEDSGSLFGVPFPRLTERLPEGWFYCGNASAKRSFLLEAGGFDERFLDDAGDDAELGLRLQARGMRTAYLPGALAVHQHSLRLRERRAAVVKGGRANALRDALYPRPHPWHSGEDERVPPSRRSVAAARLPAAVGRREAQRAAYYARTLERARLLAYRREATRLARAAASAD